MPMDIRTILDSTRLGTVWRTPPALEAVPPSSAPGQAQSQASIQSSGQNSGHASGSAHPAPPAPAPEPAAVLLRALEEEILRTFGDQSNAARAVSGVIATLRAQVAAIDAVAEGRAVPAQATDVNAPADANAPADSSLYEATWAGLDALEDLLDAFFFAGPWAPPAQI